MLQRLLRPLLALLLLVPAASATWSIVCVNARTGEVGVASATCLASFNLRNAVPVIVVGKGAAAAQSFIDFSGANKLLIFNSFEEELLTPQEILEQLAARDSQHETRQYGIVNFVADPVTFTGNRDGEAATGVTGRVGDYVYAIQGNVLTGDEVVFAAEVAFRDTKGDMGQRLMAAMHAARELGGDGRCSCDQNDPTGCGVPPPEFTKSAHVGVLIVARMGDTDDGCDPNRGCARGRYYLMRNVRSGVRALDPVLQLQGLYEIWRKNLLGRPDGVLSEAVAPATLPADGLTTRTVEVRLRDVDGHALGHGEAIVEARSRDPRRGGLGIGPVENLGNGHYRFVVTAPSEPRVDELVITATHTSRENPESTITATLFPYPRIESLAAPLRVSASSATDGRTGLAFTLDVPELPGAAYRFVLGLRTRWPADGLPSGILHGAVSPFFPAAPGHLDARGHAEAYLAAPLGVLERWGAARLVTRAFVQDGSWHEVCEPVGLDLGD
jgi:uncharacterized Ntn-hydrolase superfamily protein